MIDALSALRLQLEWGADEALGEAPLDRFASLAGSRFPAAAAPPARAAPAVAPARAAPAAPQADTLEALHAELEAFAGMPAPRHRHPHGPPRRQPGRLACPDRRRAGQRRRPLRPRLQRRSRAGLLDRVLGSVGLDRGAMLLTTLVPWRPPGNRPLSEAEIQACLPFLHRLLLIVRPQRLVLLGSAPVRTLTGHSESIRRLRGKWLPTTGIEPQLTLMALPMPPIDQWFRTPASKQELWSDLLTLQRAVTST